MENQVAYNQWLNLDRDTVNELNGIRDINEIHDRFYKDLEFGTGGLRGLMGAGTNRINTYTIRRVSAGLADYLLNYFEEPSIAIAYDTRNRSREFAYEAASVFRAAGLQVYLFKEEMPTPVLSFAVTQLSAAAGVVITASHNPKDYNGYKVYNSKGVQLVPKEANEVTAFINKRSVLDRFDMSSLHESTAKGQLTLIGEEMLTAFLLKVKEQSLYSARNIKVVYTPLHGTGNVPVRKILESFELSVVKKQEMPDGNFPTVVYPNPEDRTALQMAILQAENEKADIVIGTDPDCDRIGVAVRHQENYELLTGNQVGALLVDFLVENKQLSTKSALIKTIVTNELGTTIAKKKGLHIIDTLTGFKYIGEKVSQFETSKEFEFVMGYEESFGYLVGTHTRDKDGIVSAMLICEMAAFWKSKNKTIKDRLEELFKEYGFYQDSLQSFTFEGLQGSKRIEYIMLNVRKSGSMLFPNIAYILDYNLGIDDLPKENVIKIILSCGSWIAIRPSGTEPKIKLYYSIRGEDRAIAYKKLIDLQDQVNSILQLI